MDSKTKRRLRRQAERDGTVPDARLKAVGPANTTSPTLTAEVSGESSETVSVHPSITEILCYDAQRPCIGLVEKAISSWIKDEYFPIHLSIADFDAIAKFHRKLRPAEKVVLYVVGLLESDDCRKMVAGIRLLNRMLGKNIALDAKRERERSRLNRERQKAERTARKRQQPCLPIIRYRLEIPDNGRDPHLMKRKTD